ncbi:hypothetical protein AYK26_03565 [Euryarchaeota archaeon SM23-78]|nr:MAG: hypothetical protein AYK26_03565 [Euryarchaeota archaeon SM23-78]MBW3000550.1 nucleoside triphosphate pyrophosphohydrolase [Candidatus Woesearchaeota archaeon]
MKHNKLVRDKIPEIIKQKGKTPITYIAKDDEFWIKLKEKLLEEVNEFVESENHEELADIMEIVYAICDHKKIDIKELELLRRMKAEERGAFKNKIILDETKG